MSDIKLTDKQEMFCKEYLVDLNATQAAIRAGYSENTAKQIATENLSKPYLQEYITKLKQKRSKKIGLTQEMVVEEIRRIAFGDIKELFEWEGDKVTIKSSKELTLEQTAMIGGIVQKTSKYGDTIELKLNDKLAALEKLMKHLGGYQEDNEQKKAEIVNFDFGKLTLEEKIALKKASITNADDKG